jgi:hypothetical protein
MVARNLERGSGWLRPQLHTGPFPNLFLVEPPLFAGLAVAFRRITGLPLTASGRLVSALFTTLGAWGLYGLARRREGIKVALLAVAAFVVVPITLRYGRAFQPDIAMLGTQLAALRCWDEAGRRRTWWTLLAWPLLAASLALKVTSAYILIPILLSIRLTPPPPRPSPTRGEGDPSSPLSQGERGEERRQRWSDRPVRRAILALVALAPALLWYGHAAGLLHEVGGSRASAESATIWLGAIGKIEALGRLPGLAWRFAVVRAFTPIGFMLAIGGWFGVGKLDALWRIWAVAAIGALALLVGKAHHEYYWLILAPLAALGIGRALAALPRGWAVAAWVGFAALAFVQVRSTWQTPAEWFHLAEAAAVVRKHVPGDALVVASEALLFAADRRGCRLEFEPEAAARAAREWGGQLDPADPHALVEFYRGRGARYLAVLDPDDAWRGRVRGRYRILVDRPGVLLARLEGASDGDD